MKKKLTYLIIAVVAASQIMIPQLTIYGAEEEPTLEVSELSEILGDDIETEYVTDVDNVSGVESYEESYDEEAFVEEDLLEPESPYDISEDQLITCAKDDIPESMDGIIEDLSDTEHLLYAASERTDLTEEFREYALSDGIQYFLFKPAHSGVYYFAGNIEGFSNLDGDGNSVKWTQPYNPLSAGGTIDDSISVVAAQLTAGVEYEITIDADDPGTFYYYKSPAFCVKYIASPDADDELLQKITYVKQDTSLQTEDFPLVFPFPVVQSHIDSRLFFLTYDPLRQPSKDPVNNGDGTYSVGLYDYFTGKLVGHSRDKGKVVKTATCARGGIIRYTCLICGATFDETISKSNSHTWSAYNANGDRTCSVCKTKQHDASKVVPVYGITGKPAGVKAKAAGSRKLKVSWKKPAKSKLKKIKGFYIEVATDQNFKSIIKTKRVKKTKKSFTFKKLNKGTKYYVRVCFYKGSQVSMWSAVKKRKVK